MKTRILHTKIWKDGYFRSLTPKEKIVFIWFLTNEYVNQIWLYECPDDIIAFEVSIPSNELTKIKSKFQNDRKIAFLDSYIYLINASKYETYSGEKNELGIAKAKHLLSPRIREWYLNVSQENYDPLFSPIQSYKKVGGEYVHIKVAEKFLGRKLNSGEVVHHVDRNPSNNDPANLCVLENEKHVSLHQGNDIGVVMTLLDIPLSYPYEGGLIPIISNKEEIINNNGGGVGGEVLKEKVYSSIESINDHDILDICDKYQVPEKFVRSKLDDLINYCGSKNKRYSNYKLALMNWVKRDALQIKEKVYGKSKITIISPDPSWGNTS